MNKGIIKTVEWLQAKGYVTTDSGDGETHDYECDLDIPYVHMQVDKDDMAYEARNLMLDLTELGIEVDSGDIQATYDPVDDIGVLSLFNIKL